MKKIIVILCLVAATAMAKPLGEIPAVKKIYNEFLVADQKLEADFRTGRLNSNNVNRIYKDLDEYFIHKYLEAPRDASHEIQDGFAEVINSIRTYLAARKWYHYTVLRYGTSNDTNKMDTMSKNVKTGRLKSVLKWNVN
jgi:hypothetical protein